MDIDIDFFLNRHTHILTHKKIGRYIDGHVIKNIGDLWP